MPINFETLRMSEDDLKKMLVKYYANVLKIERKLISFLKQNKRITNAKFDQLYKLEIENNQWEAKILDEASWIISKDMPRAQHLRFVIAIIRSIRDLERMSDYVINVARYFHNRSSVNKQIYKIVTNIGEKALIILKDVYNNLISGDKQNAKYYSEQLIPAQEKFSAKYRSIFKQLGEIIFKAKDPDDALGAFTVIKNVERSVDHAVNIMENFVYISEANFYFTKESRKIKQEK